MLFGERLGAFGGVWVGGVVEVPEDVDGDGGAGAGEAVDQPGVVEFFVEGRGGGVLRELAEAGAGVGEASGGQLDGEAVEGG
ncbi:MAG: hypothetical protein AAF800_09860 [Planctomycetota bacterium]